MGERNNKLKDQKGQAGKETHQKKSCHGSKGPFQKHMAGQKFIYVKYTSGVLFKIVGGISSMPLLFLGCRLLISFFISVKLVG